MNQELITTLDLSTTEEEELEMRSQFDSTRRRQQQCPLTVAMIVVVAASLLVSVVTALSSTTTPSKTLPTIPLSSIKTSQKAILDGSEWLSVQLLLQQEGKLPLPDSLTAPSSKRRGGGPPRGPFTKYGSMTVVTGTTEDDNNNSKKRVIGIQCNNKEIYEDSIAVIPKSISDVDAITTYINSIVSVHCMLPRLNEIGGTTNVDFSLPENAKIVILGGGELACYAAFALQSLGVDHVSLITTNGNPKLPRNKNSGATGKSKLDFLFRRGVLLPPKPFVITCPRLTSTLLLLRMNTLQKSLS